MTGFLVRRAKPQDLAAAMALVERMFRDLGTSEVGGAWRAAALQRLSDPVAATTAAFVTVRADGRVVAVAVGVLDGRLPSPRRPSGRIGYVEWLATDVSHRRQGAARLAMQALMQWFLDAGVTTVDVHASAEAEQLYRSLGFQQPRATALRATL